MRNLTSPRIVIPSILVLWFFGATHLLSDRTPILVEQTSLRDITPISDPEQAQAFYGTLDNFPHTFEIRAAEPFTLFLQILLPEHDETKNNVSGIVIKEQRRGVRVEEVVRLPAKDSPWTPLYEKSGGDYYREGSSFEKELGAGVYRVEMSTPDNREKYVMHIGKRKDMTLNYFELLGRMIEVKKFLGKSSLRIIESPLVYIPVLFFIGIFLYRYVRKRSVTGTTILEKSIRK